MKKHILSIAVVLLTSACATPKFETNTARQTLNQVPDQWATYADSTKVSSGWIHEFGDPLLTKLVIEAQQSNKELQGLAANLEQANALATQAGAALKPSLGLNLGADRQSQSGFAQNSASASLQASWELDLWGRIRSERSAAQSSAQSVESDYLFAQYALASSVARAYFVAIDASIQVGVIKNSRDNLKRIEELVSLQVVEGAASKQDASVSRSDLASVESQLVAAQGAKRDAIRALELLMGRYPAADLELVSILPKVPASPLSRPALRDFRTPPRHHCGGTPSGRRLLQSRGCKSRTTSLDFAHFDRGKRFSICWHAAGFGQQIMDVCGQPACTHFSRRRAKSTGESGKGRAGCRHRSVCTGSINAFADVESGLDQVSYWHLRLFTLRPLTKKLRKPIE